MLSYKKRLCSILLVTLFILGIFSSTTLAAMRFTTKLLETTEAGTWDLTPKQFVTVYNSLAGKKGKINKFASKNSYTSKIANGLTVRIELGSNKKVKKIIYSCKISNFDSELEDVCDSAMLAYLGALMRSEQETMFTVVEELQFEDDKVFHSNETFTSSTDYVNFTAKTTNGTFFLIATPVNADVINLVDTEPTPTPYVPSTPTPTPYTYTTPTPTPDQSHLSTVYVTANGKKYHGSSCSTTNGHATSSMSRSAAESSGYTACKICKP